MHLQADDECHDSAVDGRQLLDNLDAPMSHDMLARHFWAAATIYLFCLTSKHWVQLPCIGDTSLPG